ncbi:hypothetical protein ACFOQM_06635 [Paenibacillus sp. GCM10012307]|uniref:Uncharacterized protein n=1 Tax=Paenibacillus roseus TaxID=2798579 RepID=A0A934IX97_9BACL|nr:hypothetical protein [Paenibacillus roseus]MBJ6360976.1 hypothetical protein [Paenibacillus roseus]
MKQNLLKTLLLPLLLMVGTIPIFTLASPYPARAASLQLDSMVQFRLEAALSTADSSFRIKMNELYNKLEQLQTQETDWEAKIMSLQQQNAAAIHEIRTRLKELDQVKVEKLETQARQTRLRYQPLLTLYSTLNQQAKAARTKGNKELAKKLASQAADLQLAVQLARKDIKLKEHALQAARAAKARSVAAIRKLLSEADAVTIQIKQSRTLITATKKSLSAEWKSFNQTIKNKDNTGINKSLTTLNTQSQQIVGQRQQLFQLEQKKSSIIAKAMILLAA